mmetsp:Transcript_28316/g.43233  ORF Transcript_28316/g.43233 Transcript_28316/m.43233 type:complete len:146 (-) Transcript_28316:199-636(-)
MSFCGRKCCIIWADGPAALMTIKVGGKVVEGTTRVGKAFVWAVKQLQTTGKIKKVDGKERFVLNGLKDNGFKVLTEIMDPMPWTLMRKQRQIYTLSLISLKDIPGPMKQRKATKQCEITKRPLPMISLSRQALTSTTSSRETSIH